jgi:hypothetical protein
MKTWIVAAILCFIFTAGEGFSQAWQPVEEVGPDPIAVGINPQNSRSVWFGCFGESLYV